MKKVLLIAFYFPPCGSSSTARNIGFAKNLKTLGIEPIVLTPKENTFKKLPTVRIDESYEKDLEGTRVVRTETFIPIWFIRFLFKFRLTRLFKVFFPFEFHVFWLFPALFKALKIAKREKIDLIISSSLPNTSHLIGLALHKLTKIPWIADFQDPMGYRFGDIWFTRLSHKFVCLLEKWILKYASGVTTQSKTALEVLLSHYPFLNRDRATHITNAYDFGPRTAPKVRSKKFKIVHSGEFYLDYARLSTKKNLLKNLILCPLNHFEYTYFKIDYYSHSIEPLLKAILVLVKDEPTLKEKIEVVLNGYLNPLDDKLIESMGLKDIIYSTGLTGYSKSLEIIESADLLYLPLFKDLTNERNYCIPGKTFPYMASLQPILCPVQDGDTKDIIEKSGLGIFISARKTDEIAKAIKKVFDEFVSGKSSYKPDLDYINQFSRLEQTKRLLNFAHDIMMKI